jgi:hypothetical protein
MPCPIFNSIFAVVRPIFWDKYKSIRTSMTFKTLVLWKNTIWQNMIVWALYASRPWT